MRRITVIGGHYGSGKSEIAVNMALEYGLDMLVDLDVVNPYFRSRSLHEMFKARGIHLVESTIKASSGSDLPYISGEGAAPFHNTRLRAVYDLAGTQAGAKLMRQYDEILPLKDVEFLLVVNIFRPETQSAEAIIDLAETLEGSAGLRFTGLINNTNLLNETTLENIHQGQRILRDVARIKAIPIRYTYVSAHLSGDEDFDGETKQLTRHLAKRWL